MIKNKTAVVTGGAKGLGKAMALAFAKEGANIVINYRSSIDKSLMTDIEAFGVKAVAIKADVSNFESAKMLIEEAKAAFGSIDILVNNAGITKDMLIMRMSETDFNACIDVNLNGTFNTIRHAAPLMLKQRSGAIINISSVVGIIGNAGQVNYAASKAGILGLTKSVARELAPRGITCNAIAPGFIETDMTAVLKDGIKDKLLANIPLARLGSGEDVAKTAVFLACNNYITGQVINVDGGMVMN